MLADLRYAIETKDSKNYTKYDGGWYVETTGPLQLESSEHESRSVYIFEEGYGKYKLEIQLAVQTDSVP